MAKAKEILDAVRNRNNAPQKDVAAAQMDYEQARDRYNRAQSNLDNAKVGQLARQCGKTSDQIRAMRDSGMGWGRIAKECGGRGVGKAKGKNKNMGDDMAQGKGKKPKKK
jgi:hypothetical protein